MSQNSLLEQFLFTEHVGSHALRLVAVRERANASGDFDDGLRNGDYRRQGCRRSRCR